MHHLFLKKEKIAMQNKFLYILCILVSCHLGVFGQVGINEDGSSAHESAMLDLKSTDKGFLTPRMTEAERDAITSPATSLLIYQTDGQKGFYYNAGTPSEPTWQRMGSDDNHPDIADNRIPIDSVAVFDTYVIGFPTLYAITEPGSYYLTGDVVVPSNFLGNVKGIIIDASNVTLDLNGYSIIGLLSEPTNPPTYPVNGFGASDGIAIFGEEHNITIKNGNIINWFGDGIIGAGGKNCIYSNLNISRTGILGMSVGEYSLVKDCNIFYAGEDGFVAKESSFFINCRASFCDRHGFEGDEGGQYVNCISSDNQANGFNADENSLFLGCVAKDNLQDGMNLAAGATVYKSNLYDNVGDGVRMASGTITGCNTSSNDGNGFHIISGKAIINNSLSIVNAVNGILCEAGSDGSIIQNNSIVRNNSVGIKIQSTDCLIFKNIASGHSSTYEFGSGSSYGSIINIASDGDISTVAGADHPLANFIF